MSSLFVLRSEMTIDVEDLRVSGTTARTPFAPAAMMAAQIDANSSGPDGTTVT